MSPSPAHDPAGAAPSGAAPELSPRARTSLTVLWSSFLVASAATMFFFALIDPAPVASAVLPPGLVASRTAFYSFGFLFFWIIGAASAGLTAWMRAAP